MILKSKIQQTFLSPNFTWKLLSLKYPQFCQSPKILFYPAWTGRRCCPPLPKEWLLATSYDDTELLSEMLALIYSQGETTNQRQAVSAARSWVANFASFKPKAPYMVVWHHLTRSRGVSDHVEVFSGVGANLAKHSKSTPKMLPMSQVFHKRVGLRFVLRLRVRV